MGGDERNDRMLDVAIVGGGISGICAGARLIRAGRDRIALFERSADLGGVWQANTYPGAACDIPSHLYSFSFAPSADWSHRYARQPEIAGYLRAVARRYGVTGRANLNHTVRRVRFDPDAAVWRVEADRGTWRARFLVMACGQLSDPATPSLPGAEGFAGRAYHSARWPAEFDITGRHVAVVGTGASAIQIVPAIARRAASVTVFQRTPAFIIPRRDRRYTGLDKWILRHVPGCLRLQRLFYRVRHAAFGLPFLGPGIFAALVRRSALQHLKRQARDDRLAAALWPRFPIGCKRVLVSDDFYPALRLGTVRLVTAGIDRLTANGIVDARGEDHPCDTIVYATGFVPGLGVGGVDIVGPDGSSLVDNWRADRAAALGGIMVPGLPNLFILYGPNTNLGHSSVIDMVEAQVDFLLASLAEADRRKARLVGARGEAFDRYQNWLAHKLDESPWAAGCASWYQDDRGRIVTNWPDWPWRYRRMLRRMVRTDLTFA